MKFSFLKSLTMFAIAASLTACSKDDKETVTQNNTITIQNVLDSRPLVQSGTFMGSETPPVISPGKTTSFSFYAAKNQTLTFATMYEWRNDLFFAPENPGIKLYMDDGTPITGDLSSQIILRNNGSRVNQVPGMDVTHPRTAKAITKNITEVNGMEEYGNETQFSPVVWAISYVVGGNQFTCCRMPFIQQGSQLKMVLQTLTILC